MYIISDLIFLKVFLAFISFLFKIKQGIAQLRLPSNHMEITKKTVRNNAAKRDWDKVWDILYMRTGFQYSKTVRTIYLTYLIKIPCIFGSNTNCFE